MAGKDVLQRFATCALLSCAVIVSVCMVHREFFLSSANGVLTGQHIENWKYLAGHRLPAIGSEDAPVTILEFSDYECPYCRSIERKLRRLSAQQPGSIKVIRYEFPMTLIHSHAYEAALAGKCAAKQAVMGAFQEEAYRRIGELGSVDWRELATTVKLADIEAFLSCIEKKELSGEVNADLQLGQRLGFTGTPVLVINGDVVSGDQTEEVLRLLIRQHGKY